MNYRTKIAFLITVGTIIIYSCHSSKSMRESDDCKEVVEEFIADKWSYNPETSTYRDTREMVNIDRPGTERKECLQLMNKDDLIELFGKPSREDSNRMFYFYLEEDFDRFDSTKYCTACMYILLNDSGKVDHFVFPVI